MNEIINRNQKFKSIIQELKQTCECQEFYVRKYFNGLTNQVGQQMSHKLMTETNNETKKEITILWNQLTTKLDLLEEECLQNKLIKEFTENTIKNLNEIESMFKTADSTLIERLIRIQEENIQRIIFKNRTILFLNGKDFLNKKYRELCDCKLLIINDEFISHIAFKEKEMNRYKLSTALTLELVKSIELDSKLRSKAYILEEAFNLNSLKSLNLTAKQLTQINQEVFNEMPNLQLLSLAWNQLSEINENTFKNLKNLKHLDLCKNKLRGLLNGIVFQSQNKLENLLLTENRINTINNNSFQYLTNLRQLYLGSNEIRELDENTFCFLVNLEKLYLYKNKINQLKDNTFKCLINLKELDLENNELSSINETTFNGLTSLQSLNLSGNKINEINFIVLNSMCSCLVKLELKGNQLSTLNEIDYRRMIQLKELNLSDNKITKKSQPGLEKELSKIRKRGIIVLLPVQPARKRQKPKSKSIFSK